MKTTRLRSRAARLRIMGVRFDEHAADVDDATLARLQTSGRWGRDLWIDANAEIAETKANAKRAKRAKGATGAETKANAKGAKGAK